MAKTPEQKVAEAQERLARAKAQARKADTRRKVLMGTFMQTHFSEQQRREMMNGYLKRDSDRKLFGLEPLSKPDPEPDPDQEPDPAQEPTPEPGPEYDPHDPFGSIMQQ